MKSKLSYIYLLLSAIVGGIITIVAYKAVNNNNVSVSDNSQSTTEVHNYKEMRLGGYKYIQPLVMIEPDSESEKYTALKQQITSFIEQEVQGGKLTTASVYTREFSKGDWMAVNPEEKYDPGSLLKVAVLMAVLKMSETDPALLNKELVYYPNKALAIPREHYKSDTIADGHKYKVSELLRYMIINSDNKATLCLESNVDVNIFKKVFTDLGMAEPNFKDKFYKLGAVEYSVLFKAIFNAGYLNVTSSEYAAALLTESKFKEGLVKELPPLVTVAHKFGESGDQNMYELHESGIVYINNNPYLITIMTKGTDWNELSKVIAHISKMVYDKMLANTMNYSAMGGVSASHFAH